MFTSVIAETIQHFSVQLDNGWFRFKVNWVVIKGMVSMRLKVRQFRLQPSGSLANRYLRSLALKVDMDWAEAVLGGSEFQSSAPE